MTEELQETHNSGLLYFMPAWIFESKELSNTEKMVYSLLSGLAYGNESKQCFPSDAYIGKRLGIGRQAANDCVAALEKIGAISKVTVKHENNPFRNKRIITVYLCPKIIFTKSQKDDSRESQKCDTAVSQKDDSSNKDNSNIEREACGAFVKLSKEEKAKAIELCGEKLFNEIVEEMNDYCAAHGKKYKDYLAAIRTWWKKRAKSTQQKETKEEKNKKWAQNFVNKMSHLARCRSSEDCLIFEGVGNWSGEYIKFTDNGFQDQVLNRTRKMGLIQFWERD